MSLELKDIRCKVDAVAFAFLEGEARARGVDKCVVLREIIDLWVDVRHEANTLTQRLMAAEGHTRAVRVSRGNGRPALSFDDPE